MRISISGAQGVGKTTVMNALKKTGELSEYTYIDEIVRTLVNSHGIKVNEQGNDDTQLLIANVHYLNSMRNDNIITDRSLIDCLSYTIYLSRRGLISLWIVDYIENLTRMVMDRFDLMFYIPPEFNIVDDGFRSTNDEFQNEINNIMKNVIHKYIYNEDRIITVSGTVDARVSLILDTIKRKV